MSASNTTATTAPAPKKPAETTTGVSPHLRPPTPARNAALAFTSTASKEMERITAEQAAAKAAVNKAIDAKQSSSPEVIARQKTFIDRVKDVFTPNPKDITEFFDESLATDGRMSSGGLGRVFNTPILDADKTAARAKKLIKQAGDISEYINPKDYSDVSMAHAHECHFDKKGDFQAWTAATLPK